MFGNLYPTISKFPFYLIQYMNFFTFIFYLFSLRFTQHLFPGVYNNRVAADSEIDNDGGVVLLLPFFFCWVFTLLASKTCLPYPYRLHY